jgi:hypothetical protein
MLVIRANRLDRFPETAIHTASSAMDASPTFNTTGT